MTDLLSGLQRSNLLKFLQSEPYDLLVIGGGITGAGIALDAASRGIKTALIEKDDFASGTSSKSTKLIHGGLRYLKQFEIGLVREVGRERATVHRLAPHLAKPEKMLLPLVEGGTYGKLATSFGLKVYDFLANVGGDDQRRMLSRKATLQQEPLLRKEGLLGGGLYAEYRTDDARLTIEIIKTAAEHGAHSINYLKAEEFIYEEGQVTGIKATDQLSGETASIHATYVVSAAGPWVDELRSVNKSLKGKHLFHSKGVHIVVPHDRLPLRQAVYFDVPDGRMLFAIPRHQVTYIGTTDTEYKGDLDKVLADQEDVNYLLKGANSMFPEAQLTSADVESTWAGLRPLIHEEGKSPSEMSRKDEIFESETGLVSIAGGKLTGYRKMAERVVDLIVQKFHSKHQRNFPACTTQQITLHGGDFSNYRAVLDFEKQMELKAREMGIPESYAPYLVSNYGAETEKILDHSGEYQDSPAVRIALAELHYCIHNELTFTLEDFFNRRTGRLYFMIKSIPEVITPVLSAMKEAYNWDNSRTLAEENQLKQSLEEVVEFH
jgi:glycerol-3-phosphate dehydrogenase